VLRAHHLTPRYKNWHLQLKKDEESFEVIESMLESNFIIGGLFLYHDEGWIFIGETSLAKECYYNNTVLPLYQNLIATVSLLKGANLSCISAYKLIKMRLGSVKCEATCDKGKGNSTVEFFFY
jgi:hypothetical protein